MAFLTQAANRGSISTGYDIDNSIKFEADNTEYLKWTDFSSYASDARKRTFSISFWCKRTELGVQQLIWNSGANGYLSFEAGDTIKWQQFFSDSASAAKYLNTNRLFRDTSAWYHIIIAIDTTQGTEANRMRLYVNGEEETSFASTVYPPQNATATNVYGDYLSLGRSLAWGAGYCGYVADYLFVSEVQLVPSDVGEVDEDSGIWKPKAYSGTISSPSQFLEFQDGSDLGTATSGLDADTMNNIAAADQATDTPTNNFATFNPLLTHGANDYFVVTNGSTHLDQTGQVGWGTSTATMAFNLGKWYAEFKLGSGVDVTMIGNSQIDNPQNYSASHLGVSANTTSIGMGYYSANGLMYRNGGSTSYGDSYNTSGTIIGVALEFEANGTASMYVSKNGTWQNSADPAAGSGGFDLYYGNALPTGLHFTFAVSTYNNDGNIEANFGGFNGFTVSSGNTDANGYGTFEYAPPSGYYALCTKNLAEYG